MSTFSEMQEVVRAMRELGVLSYSKDGMKIILGPEVPATSTPETEMQAAAQLKKGKDGLTAAEQQALYGKNFSDTEV